jgi:hypothetical protein
MLRWSPERDSRQTLEALDQPFQCQPAGEADGAANTWRHYMAALLRFGVFRLLVTARMVARTLIGGSEMRFVVVLCAVAIWSSASFAETRPIGAGASAKMRIAQTYCGQCNDARISCIAKCNGSGACIQKCSDDFDTCLEQNFCRGRR